MTAPTHDPIRLATVVASTREGRFAPVVADWFSAQVAARDDVIHEVVDLAKAGLPDVLPRGPHPAVDDFLARIDAADAMVLIVPEYNHSFPASIKQALDLSGGEWRAKPVAFVAYGGMSGGLRAVEHLRPVLAELAAATIRNTVSFHGARRTFDGEGRPLDPEGPAAAARVLLDELVWWAQALRTARRTSPPPR